MKLFISQSMTSREPQEVLAERWKIKQLIKFIYPNRDIELINQYDCPEDMPTFTGYRSAGQQGVWLLGRSIQMMFDADIVVVWGNPLQSKGMMSEYEVIRQYKVAMGWDVLYEKDIIELVKKFNEKEFMDIMDKTSDLILKLKKIPCVSEDIVDRITNND